MRSLRLIVFAVLTLALNGLAGRALCAEVSQPANDAAGKNGGRARVLVLGDSITAGYGLDPSQAYPALLQKKIDAAKLPFEVVNAGVSGDTTAGGLRRINWVLAKGADVVIVALGGNDGLRGISPEETAANLRGIVEKARSKTPSSSVIIAGMQMPDNMGPDYVKEFRSIFPAVAKEAKAVLVPFLLEGIGADPELNQSDLIHPNAEGQERVAENVWAVLEKVLRDRG